jgi:hypothetical protein
MDGQRLFKSFLARNVHATFYKRVIFAGQPIGRSNPRSFFLPALKLEPLNPCIGDSNA